MPSSPCSSRRNRSRRAAAAVAILCWSATAAAQVRHQNLAELTSLAPDIVVGTVVAVRDGIAAGNLPWTEVTVAVSRTVKGSRRGTMTFRQFGMQTPRSAADGRTNVMLTPAGWPRFAAGEEVMLFLFHPGRSSGLRTTVGLEQGKFTIRDGRIANGADNAGLLDRMNLPPARAARSRTLLGGRGPVDAAAFIDLVDAAVREKWFEPAP